MTTMTFTIDDTDNSGETSTHAISLTPEQRQRFVAYIQGVYDTDPDNPATVAEMLDAFWKDTVLYSIRKRIKVYEERQARQNVDNFDPTEQ